jgi:hypothetical protein
VTFYHYTQYLMTGKLCNANNAIYKETHESGRFLTKLIHIYTYAFDRTSGDAVGAPTLKVTRLG